MCCSWARKGFLVPLIHGITEVAGRLLVACTMCLQIMSMTFQRVSKSVVCSGQVAVPAADSSEVMEEYSGFRKQRKWPGQLSTPRLCSPGRGKPHALCSSLSSQAGPLLRVFAFLLSCLFYGLSRGGTLPFECFSVYACAGVRGHVFVMFAKDLGYSSILVALIQVWSPYQLN